MGIIIYFCFYLVVISIGIYEIIKDLKNNRSVKSNPSQILEKLEKEMSDLKSKQPQNWIGKWANSILIEKLEKKISDLKSRNRK
jgi:hypothetical protein